MNTDMIRIIIDEINYANNIAIVMHNSPDADAIGSSAAFENILRQLDKHVDIIIQSKINSAYSPVIGSKRVNKILIPNKVYDVLFILDCSEICRVNIEYLQFSCKIIVIDHHFGFESYGDIYWCENVPATAILIFELAKQLQEQKKIEINKKIATALYLGLRGDTLNFTTYDSTYDVHKIASELFLYNANIQQVNEIEQYNFSMVKLLGDIIKDIIYDSHYKIIYLYLTRENIYDCNTTFYDSAKIVDILRNIKNVNVAFLFIRNNNIMFIKARSNTINISSIIKSFGGGGHEHAAGCACYVDSSYSLINAVITKTKQKIDEMK